MRKAKGGSQFWKIRIKLMYSNFHAAPRVANQRRINLIQIATRGRHENQRKINLIQNFREIELS